MNNRVKQVVNIIVLTLVGSVLLPEVQAQAGKDLNTPPGSRSYRDADAAIIYYVESDGHHIAALDKAGKVLWCRQPALEGDLPPYSATEPRLNPVIVWIGALRESEKERMKNTGSGQFIGIAFSSRQAGMVDIENGNFTFQGQD